MALPSFPWLSRDRGAWCRSALAKDVSLQGAVDAVTQQLAGAGRADLALVFAYSGFASDLPRLLPLPSRFILPSCPGPTCSVKRWPAGGRTRNFGGT